jgi:tetratricopeptide (TPR) repeat protein
MSVIDELLNLLNRVEFPATYPYLLGILGLTLIWKFHDMQVKAGRIQAKDFWARSGVRLFLRATPNDSQACTACRETTNMVFLPGEVASKKFKPQEKPCTNPVGCRCLMVGLYGGWAEARLALEQLKQQSGRVRLSDDDLKGLVEGAQSARAGASADRMSIRMLNAMRAEGNNPETAIAHYRYVVSRAEEDRNLAFMVPAYLRLGELLEKSGKAAEALEMVERCLRDYGDKKKGPDAPTEAQRTALNTRKNLLAAKVKR